MSNVKELLKEKLTTENYDRLMALDNPKMHEFIADAIELTGAASVFVSPILTKTEFIFASWRLRTVKKFRWMSPAIRVTLTAITTRPATRPGQSICCRPART